MGKKRSNLTRLYGQLYINRETGDIVYRWGGWHNIKITNIKGTKAFQKFKETYGTKEGKKFRERLALALIRSVSKSKTKKKKKR